MAVVDDLHQVTPLLCSEFDHGPIVENQEFDAGDGGQRPGLASGNAGDRQVVEQPRQTLVEHRHAVAGGLIAECAGDPAFPDAGRPGDQDVEVLANPGAGRERLDGGAVKAAWRAQIKVLQTGGLTHAGTAQALLEGFVEHGGMLGIDKKRKAFLEGEGRHVGIAELGPEAVGHGLEAHGQQLFDSWIDHREIRLSEFRAESRDGTF